MVKIVLPILVWTIVELVIAILLIFVTSLSSLTMAGIIFFGISSLAKLIYVAIANYL